MQLGWTAIVVVAMSLAWRTSIKQFSAVGTYGSPSCFT
jgi:hypothetical protein